MCLKDRRPPRGSDVYICLDRVSLIRMRNELRTSRSKTKIALIRVRNELRQVPAGYHSGLQTCSSVFSSTFE